MLLLSADSEAEMWEWIERLNRARGHPECEATAVAPLIHYATGPEPLFQEARTHAPTSTCLTLHLAWSGWRMCGCAQATPAPAVMMPPPAL